MAPKKGLSNSQKKYLSATRENIAELQRVLGADRRSDTRTANSAINAAYANALTTLRGLTKNFTARQARDFQGMDRTLASVGKQGSLDKAKAEVAGDLAGGFRSADARVAGAARVVGAEAKGAVRYSKASQAGLEMLRVGLQSQKLETQEALADAMSGRADIDATAIFNAEQELLQQKMAFQQEKAAIRLEQRMEERANEQGYGDDYRAASATINEAALAMTRSEAVSLITGLGYQYNLGPQALARLQSQVDALWTSQDPASHSSMYQEEGSEATNEFGEPFVYRGSREETAVKREVASVVHAALRGDVDAETEQPWTLNGLKEQVLLLFVEADGTPKYPEAFIMQALAYAEHVWNNNMGVAVPRDASGAPPPRNELTRNETGASPPTIVGRGMPA